MNEQFQTVSDMAVTSTLKWKALYEGQYGSNASYFFLRNCNYSYNEIYIYLGYILLQTSDHFPQSPSLSAQFSHLCVRCSMPVALNSLLISTHAVFQLKEMDDGGC
jgi:hypothetical protein